MGNNYKKGIFMKKLFETLSIYKTDPRNPAIRESMGTIAGAVGILSNVFLFAVKIAVGLLSGSISIIADAINNLSDSGSSLMTIIGFKLASKPADKEHPFGHERMEYLTGLFVSAAIIIIGFELLTSSFDKLFSPEPTQYTVISVAVLVLSIAVKLIQGRFYRNVGKRINSEALSATAQDSFNDVISTAAVLVGAVITMLTKLDLDGYIGIAVALFIMYSGVKLVIETADPLIGKAPDKELVDKIVSNIKKYDGILGIHDLMIHSYGADRCFASVHAEVPAERDILESHEIIDNIEHDFKTNLNIHLIIHLDPVVTDCEETNDAHELVYNVVKSISPNITMHDFRVVFGKGHSNLIFDVCVPYGFEHSDEELCYLIDKRVKEKRPDFNTVVTVDKQFL